MTNPLERCAVCGFRRFTHWRFGFREFYRVSSIGPPPKRRWFQ